jgi:mRNA-degrading endonuclease RelE of RelBE toxin-antitoxin system
MASYHVALTSSAEKELKRLSSQLIARIISRLEDLAANPRALQVARSYKAVIANGAFVSEITVWCTPSTTPNFWWR